MCLPKIESKIVDLRARNRQNFGMQVYEGMQYWEFQRHRRYVVDPVHGESLGWIELVNRPTQPNPPALPPRDLPPVITLQGITQLYCRHRNRPNEPNVWDLVCFHPDAGINYTIMLDREEGGIRNIFTLTSLINTKRFEKGDSIVLMGNTDIRFWGEQTPRLRKKLFACFSRNMTRLGREIAAQHASGKKGNLVFVGTLPLRESEPTHLKKLARRVNNLYFRMAQNNPQCVGYLSLKSYFTGDHDSYFEADGIHLSRIGTRLTASIISELAKTLANLKNSNIPHLNTLPAFARPEL